MMNVEPANVNARVKAFVLRGSLQGTTEYPQIGQVRKREKPRIVPAAEVHFMLWKGLKKEADHTVVSKIAVEIGE